MPQHAMRVLVVDDDPASQLLLVRLLREYGFGADGATSGREAVRATAEVRYDAVLMDIIMPDLNGLGAARQIREADRSVMIIAVTGYDSPALRQSCADAGIAGVLAKPIAPDVVLKFLRPHSHV